MKAFATIFFLFPLLVSAQDITGVWTGYLRTPGSKLDYELAISEGDKKLSGYSLIVYPKDGIENIGIKKAKIKQGKKGILIEDGELVYDNFSAPPTRVKMFGNLSLVTKDSLMILRGTFSTRSLDFRDTRTYSGEIYLQKSGRPVSSKLLITLEEINFPHNLSFATTAIKKKKEINQPNVNNLKKNVTPDVTINPKPKVNRKIEKIRDIVFSSDSLLLSFYDNGTIDGDTVSIVLNGKMLVENLGLTANAFKILIPVNIKPGDSLMLVMHAESLGLIPPNTGLLIIQDGETRHEIRFEGDLQKSSAIMLRKKRS
ncbi:MAG TPA: hypothetical protein VKB95_15040 [Chitinophagaceae bacterium]|nr:hypothetical protein [Chitinophagaceae bacterium]